MLDVFSGLVQALTTAGNFLVSFFSGILAVFGLVGDCWVFLQRSWLYMPSPLLVFATAGLTICIVYQLIGR